jgi:RNA polymerase sigma-70 factor, ECF subfamily
VDFEPYRGELVAYCYRMLGSFHEAEDPAQETMLRAWKARDRYDRTRAGDAGEITEPDDPGARAVIDRYVRAFEAADVPALVRLLADEAVLEMPPVPLWYRGRRDYGRFMRRVFEMRGAGWGIRRLSASGQPAFAAYAPEPGGGLRLHTLQVFTVTSGRIVRNVVFADPAVFEAFGLPERVSSDELRPAR